MARKKKTLTFEEKLNQIAEDYKNGKFGRYPDCKHAINGMGMGNIYAEIKKRDKIH